MLVCFNKSLVYGRVFFIETDFLVFKNNLLILVCAHCVARCSVMSDSFATPWTHQAPLSMGFPRQEYWSGLPFPSPEDLPEQGTELASPVSPALAGSFVFFFFFTIKPPGKLPHPYTLH